MPPLPPLHAHGTPMTSMLPRLQGFNFCDGAPLTGGERLELCYFPGEGGDRSVAGGGGETASIDPCVVAEIFRVRSAATPGGRPHLLAIQAAAAVPPQDPHLSFPYGGTADFRGRDGQYYCFLSAPRLAINIKTEDATFRLFNLYDKGGTLVVEGSFITEAQPAGPVGLQETCLERVMTSIPPTCACAGARCRTRRWAEE